MLKNIGKIIGGLAFPFTISLFIALMTLSQVIDSGGLKEVSSEALRAQLAGVDEQTVVGSFKLQCQNKETIPMDFGGDNIQLNCNTIRNSQSLDDIIDALFESVYEKTYPCTFTDCISYPEIILTKQGTELIQSSTNIFLISSIIFGIILALSLKGFGILKGIGIAMLSVGILYFPMKYLPADPQIASLAAGITDTFAENFLLPLYLGMVLTIIGFAGERWYNSKHIIKS